MNHRFKPSWTNSLFDRELDELLRQNDWDDFSGWPVELQDFDEVPLYSRYAQVEFLSHIPLVVGNDARALAVRTWLSMGKGDFVVSGNARAGDPVRRIYVTRPPMSPSLANDLTGDFV